ncbi:SMI1/KNR4 family protein [Undibacterium sp.]|uniref:SMI1/KNR4 family protein n=1 Tax=Undibacterium sp. TaxID=1914977 RepID=UPI002BDEF758|nr:SMI1/KNR4 family protein [Undibacterium sp.]HTD03814.1 SMI1/KNR4 family protein [Undibacterium sp.]
MNSSARARPSTAFQPFNPEGFFFVRTSKKMTSRQISDKIICRIVINPRFRILSNPSKEATMLQHLNAIKQIFSDKNALELMQLNPGASEEELLELERHLGVTLPADFKEYLSVHNGQQGQDGMIFNEPLLSIEQIKDEWTTWYEIGEDGTMNDDCAEFMSANPVGHVKPMYTNPKWIPFTHDGGGNHIGIDLDPDVKGTLGQVIIFGRDEDEKSVMATSFTEFLATVVHHLKNQVDG